jgi:mRNA interferase RelE/StbE
MSISLRPAARDVLLRLDKPTRRRLQYAIDGLAIQAQPQDAVGLRGQPGALRLRVGDHQLVYTIKQQEVLVLLIDNRNIL